MADDKPIAESGPPGTSEGSSFETTDWGLIEAARRDDGQSARQAMTDLCASYWYPLYAFIRRKGYQADQAQDLTQGLFESLLRRDFLRAIGPEKGRFRSYLLAACKHYLSNQRDRQKAWKRGGRSVLLSFDLPDAEGRYANEPSHVMTADRLFERRWALTLLEHVLGRVHGEMACAGKSALFELLKPALLADGGRTPYAEIAAQLQMTEEAVKMAAHRVRRRYRDLVREEVARTVGPGVDVDAEIQELFTSLAD